MNREKKNSNSILWILVLLLFVCVAATAFIFFNNMNVYLPDDEGAISLTDELMDYFTSDNTSHSSDVSSDSTDRPTSSSTADSAVTDTDSDTSASMEENTSNPGFEVEDDNGVWTTQTQVEIFRVSYENGEQIVTVNSGNGDKIIAPGTENSYVFKLKNTGDVALDYTVEIDAYVTPASISIPITGRLSRYDGVWVVGDSEQYAQLPQLDEGEDSAVLGAGNYTYYVLDWAWPFEGESDELDTYLGNLAMNGDLTFTLSITTTATESDDPFADGGIKPPPTGDNVQTVLWSLLAVCISVIVLLLIFYRKKQQETEEARR